MRMIIILCTLPRTQLHVRPPWYNAMTMTFNAIVLVYYNVCRFGRMDHVLGVYLLMLLFSCHLTGVANGQW